MQALTATPSVGVTGLIGAALAGWGALGVLLLIGALIVINRRHG